MNANSNTAAASSTSSSGRASPKLKLSPSVRDTLSVVADRDEDETKDLVTSNGQTYERQRIRIVLVGDSNVGKTEFANCFKTRTFSGTTVASIGIGFTSVDMLLCQNRVYASVALYDTAGQERYAQITPMYYRKAHGMIIMFDPQTDASVLRATKLYRQITEEVPDIVCMFVANKTDLFTCTPDERAARLAKLAGLLRPPGQPTRVPSLVFRPDELDISLKSISLKEAPGIALDLVAELSQRVVLNNAAAATRVLDVKSAAQQPVAARAPKSGSAGKSDVVRLRREEKQPDASERRKKKRSDGFCFF